GVEGHLQVQVALGGRAAPDQVRLVGVSHVRRIPIDVRIDGDRPDAELAQRPEDADRDLASVGDEHFAENGHWPRILSGVSLPDVLTVARAASVPFVILLYAWN